MDDSVKKANLIFWPIAIALFILWLVWGYNIDKDYKKNYKPPSLDEQFYMEEFEPRDDR